MLTSPLTGFLSGLREMLGLLSSTFQFLLSGRIRLRSTVTQMVRVGVESLPLVSIVAVFTGMVMSLQTSYQLQKFGAEIYVGGIVAISMARELGPVMAAIMVAGRVGSGVAAELGTMKVTEQIDALKSMAVNPVEYLVVPRFLGCVLMMPLLTVFANVIGYLGAWGVSVTMLGVDSGPYWTGTQQLMSSGDLFSGLAKTVVFGGIVALVGCYMGFRTERGASGVGYSTTYAVVLSATLILISDYLMTAVLFF